MRLSTIVVSLLLPLGTSASCNADNCLRALRAPTKIVEAQAFCATFTTAVVAATSAIPSYAVAACGGDVAGRVSSACSCIAISTSSSTRSSTSVAVPTSTSVSSTESATSSSSTSVVVPTSPSTTETGISTSTTSSVSSVTTSTSSPPTSTPTGFPSGPKTCLNPQLSCHNTTAVADLCCFNAPGGQLLQTQFWDTSPSTGPADSWTLHGLWPDRCDGSYDANCDPSREYTNITAILQSYNQTDLLTYMNKYWKDYQGNDESFWEHEWAKHGTCISTLEPSCYNGYTGQEEVVDYFEKAVSLFQGLDSYKFLANAGILPSTTVTYTSAQIQDALTAAHGFPVTIGCSGGALDEIWYHYDVRGSVQTGEFVSTSPDGSKSSCGDTGVKYLPKYQTPTTTSTTSANGPTGTAAPYAGKGFLQGYTGGAQKGCLISGGTWYTAGTCATYTATTSGTGFTLTSSKGPCAILADTSFSCAAGNTPTVFTSLNGSLAYGTSSDFYAAAVPSGSVQQKVFTTSNVVKVTFAWQGV